MFVRRCLMGLLICGVALSVCDCDSPSLVSIAITPTTEVSTYAPGAATQYEAIGTFAQGNHPNTTQDITDEVTWKSNNTDIATVNSKGLVTIVGTAAGTSIISARMNGFTGLIIANATFTVCLPGQTLSNGACTSPSSSGSGSGGVVGAR